MLQLRLDTSRRWKRGTHIHDLHSGSRALPPHATHAVRARRPTRLADISSDRGSEVRRRMPAGAPRRGASRRGIRRAAAQGGGCSCEVASRGPWPPGSRHVPPRLKLETQRQQQPSSIGRAGWRQKRSARSSRSAECSDVFFYSSPSPSPHRHTAVAPQHAEDERQRVEYPDGCNTAGRWSADVVQCRVPPRVMIGTQKRLHSRNGGGR